MTVPCGCYLRLSILKARPELTEDAIERQREGTLELAKHRGWTVVEQYVEEGVSAFRGKHRGEFERALADLQRGHIKVLVVFKLDRVIRNMWDLLRLERVLEQSGGILASVHDDWGDTSTAAGRFMLRTFASLAEMESENISLRVTAQHKQRAHAGKPIVGGNRPYGWDRHRTEVVPEEATVVVECARRVLRGDSLRSIVTYANTVSRTPTGAPWQHKSLKRILTSPSTVGDREYHGEVVATGQWTPLLDRETWMAVRALLNDPARARPGQPAKHLLSGLLFCGRDGCGAKLLTHWAEANKRQYMCQRTPGVGGCGRLAIDGPQLDTLVEERVLDRLSGPGLDRARAQLARQREDRLAVLAELDGARARRDEIERMFTEGLIDQPAFTRMHGPAELRVQKVQALFDQQTSASALAELPRGAEALRAWWFDPDRTVDERRAVVTQVVERIEVGSAPVRGRRFDPTRIMEPLGRVVWRT
jgi:site-specific DNA recombinase